MKTCVDRINESIDGVVKLNRPVLGASESTMKGWSYLGAQIAIDSIDAAMIAHITSGKRLTVKKFMDILCTERAALRMVKS